MARNDRRSNLLFEPKGDTKSERLERLKKLVKEAVSTQTGRPPRAGAVNNHIHTAYSFSPYSPSAAVWAAYRAGLNTAGLMDHDTIAGAEEFLEAGRIVGLAVTVGLECRARFDFPPAAGRRINNPDQDANCYMAIHGIPHSRLKAVQDWFSPILRARLKRSRKMVDKLNNFSQSEALRLDFDRDILPLSLSPQGGTLTERHICFGLARKLIAASGKGGGVISFLSDQWRLSLTEKQLATLNHTEDRWYDYNLLSILKSCLVEKFYLPATAECPDVRDIVAFALGIGAIPAYAYLGDVTDSVTGDKKPEKFEDDYLDALFTELQAIGFPAVTYMPARNTLKQLKRVQALCDKHQFFQISGEDINSPHQSFICPVLSNPEFSHLIDSTWALIGHEREATEDVERGMFTQSTKSRYPSLRQRIAALARKGRKPTNDTY